MLIISPLFVVCSSFFLFLVLVVLIYRHKSNFHRSKKNLQSDIEAQELLFNELQSFQYILKNQLADLDNTFKKQKLENEQVNKQLEHRIRVLQQESTTQKQLIEQLKNEQPQDKLYSRAFKLVALGADIDEVVRECDIPRAEAEMLMSVHKNKTSSS
jgi:predicted RNase H-like nuclease (RuvC/YqgF family)